MQKNKTKENHKPNPPIISIIISTKNEEENIGRLLESVKSQDYLNYEIIVVDNNSTDKTVDIASKYTDKIFTRGPERSAQRNFGAKKARGDYLLILDADMELNPQALSIYVSDCQRRSVDALALPEENPAPDFWARCRNLEKLIAQGEAHLNAARFVKKKAFALIGGYDNNLISAEDYDLDDRLQSAGFKIGTTDVRLKHWANNNLIEMIKKKYYYGKILHKYVSKNPRSAYQRFNPLRAAYFKKVNLLLAQPHLALGLIVLKLVDYLAGGAGILVGTSRTCPPLEGFVPTKASVMNHITAVLTSHNEERKIENALKSVQWADEIILVDGESTDKTVEFARKYTTKIITTPNDPGMMSMRNKGIESARGDWVLILDSDEIIPNNLAQAIQKIILRESPLDKTRGKQDKYAAYRFPRKAYFLGKWVKHCGWYPDYQTRLFKKDHGHYQEEHVHEQVTITNGKTGTIDIPFEHYSYYDFSEFLFKLHRYIKFEAGKLTQREKPPAAFYYLILRPPARFLSIYIRQKGILDGWRGLVLSLFAGYHEFMTCVTYLTLDKDRASPHRKRVSLLKIALSKPHWMLIDFSWLFYRTKITPGYTQNKYTIGITTYITRYKKYFVPLITKLGILFPDTKIIIAINGYYDREKQLDYLKRINSFLDPYKNIKIIEYVKPQSLSKLWNQIIIHSPAEKILVLNDDLNISPYFRKHLEKSRILKKEIAIINHSWSHFLISKKTVSETGWFDERFSGIGYEDCDYEARLTIKDKTLAIVMINSLRNLTRPPTDFSWGKNIKIIDKKYTAVNKEFFDKKWEVSTVPKKGFIRARVLQAHARLKPFMETPNFYPRVSLYGVTEPFRLKKTQPVNIVCIICESKDTKLIYKNYPGYTEGTTFNIFKCDNCDTHFISPEKAASGINELLYSNPDTPGYDRYYKYAQQIKSSKEPLRFLSEKEAVYYLVYKYLKNKPSLKILEVGCGYGYLTYALNHQGHQSTGIDISETAINFALKNFGNCFVKANIESFTKRTNRKYDLIIATELIEHLPQPGKFISKCLETLGKNGKIVIATPNRDYFPKTSIWQTDMPPIHTCWLGHKSFQVLSQSHQLAIRFEDFRHFVPPNDNYLTNFLFSREEKLPSPIFTRKGNLHPSRVESRPSIVQQVLKSSLVHFAPIRYFSNRLSHLLTREHSTLGVVLRIARPAPD
ncbi:glycosyltransferase [Patescibacteria group bacterium]|nr:glycosyltransferase [Patescibacteria group bacterium]